MVILSPKEKEALVIDLLDKNYTLREIAKKAHVSFSFVSKVRKKQTGEDVVDDKVPKIPKQLSIPSQAFQLLEDKKTLVDVAVILDISKDETIKIFLDYLALKNLHKVAAILKENINNLSAFIKWLEYIKINKIKKSEVSRAIENIKQIDALIQQKKNLQKEIQEILEDRDCYLRDLENIKREYYK